MPGLIRRMEIVGDLAFVNFVHREDAEKAISKLNGYGYDNLILRVEWATPRPN
jgi:translation initiation factor 3 subunit G